MKLEIKHLAPYLPYGLKMEVQYFGQSLTSELLGLDCSSKFAAVFKECSNTLESVKPLLLPLSELKGFMPGFLKELSKLTLDDCTFEENESDEENNEWWVNAFDGDRVIACLTFDGNIFSIQYWHGSADDSFQTYEPQYEALSQLFKNHFDVFNLIDAGIALDKQKVK